MTEEPKQDAEVGREDTLLRQKVVRLTIALGAVLAVALLVSLGFALRWYLSPQTDLSISQRQDLVQGLASAGQALAVLLTGVVGLIGLYLTRRNTDEQLRQARESTREQLEQARESQKRTEESAQKTLRLTEQGQITERFTRAIDQLGATDDSGKSQLEIRLGGIYALERIARDSARDYGPVMEVLTAYVRKNAPWSPGEPSTLASSSNSAAERNEGTKQAASRTLRTQPADILAILDVLKRLKKSEPKGHRINLDLSGTNLQGVNFEGVNLQEANFQEANLKGGWFFRANLFDANLQGADLRNAFLSVANLQRANLKRANLQKAMLQSSILQAARLQEANLQEAFWNYPEMADGFPYATATSSIVACS